MLILVGAGAVACVVATTAFIRDDASPTGAEAMSYRHDYPNEPIGGGNPYYRCCACGRSDPEINGRIEGHYEWCEWRKEQERNPSSSVTVGELVPA